MEPLISVILPVYNVEKYISKCIESLLTQTYKNLEIIFVNDCSTDNSINAIKEYASIDSRIKLINNPQNVGPGISRNNGIKIAQGEYINFIDPDDWIEKNSYEILVNYLNKAPETEVLRFSLSLYEETTGELDKGEEFPPEILYKETSYTKNPEIIDHWSLGTCNKLFKKQFLLENNILFNNHKTHEDVEFSVKTLLGAKKVMFVPEKFLNYRIHRPNSRTDKSQNHIDDIVKDSKWLNEIANSYEPSVFANVQNIVYESLLLNSLNAYYYRIIPFKKLYEIIITNLNPDVLKNSYYKKLYNRIKNSNQFTFWFRYSARRWVKASFPAFTKFYFKRIRKSVQ